VEMTTIDDALTRPWTATKDYRKRREASTVIVLADFGIGWIAQLSLLTSAKLDVGLCSASSMTRPPDVD